MKQSNTALCQAKTEKHKCFKIAAMFFQEGQNFSFSNFLDFRVHAQLSNAAVDNNAGLATVLLIKVFSLPNAIHYQLMLSYEINESQNMVKAVLRK